MAKSHDRDDAHDEPEHRPQHDEKAAEREAKAADLKAHQLATKPTQEQIDTSIGVDLGATGSYVYEDVPPPENPKLVTITRQGKQLWHVADDAFGRWLYR